jgi:hypothetical protein
MFHEILNSMKMSIEIMLPMAKRTIIISCIIILGPAPGG